MKRLSVILVATGLSLGAVSVGMLVWCGVQAFEAQYASGYVDGHRAGTDFALMEFADKLVETGVITPAGGKELKQLWSQEPGTTNPHGLEEKAQKCR